MDHIIIIVLLGLVAIILAARIDTLENRIKRIERFLGPAVELKDRGWP